ncbi:flippase [Pseudoalteromonas haloplanktis]|nr:flippase [Pseudoalteromonas haloplanktis]
MIEISVTQKLNRAILSSLSGKYATYLIQIISLMILSRLFDPATFGKVAAIQVFVMFFQMLSSSGLNSAIVYKDEISVSERDGIFSATLLVGIFATIIYLLLSPSIFSLLRVDSDYFLNIILAISIVFSASSIMPLASLQKDTKFILVARAEIFAELMSLLACYITYLNGYEERALGIKIVTVAIIRFIAYYYFSSETGVGRPFLGSKVKSINSLMGVAKFQLAFNVVNYFSRNLDTILIARYFGVATVGFYEKSYQLMRYPLQMFTFAITPALQPVLTKYKDTPEIVKNEFYKVAFKLSLLGIFASTILFYNAKDVIFILFGSQWGQTIPILQVLAVTIPLQMVLSSTGGIYQAFGATKDMFKCGVFSSFLNILAILIGIYLGNVLVLCGLLTLSFFINYLQCFYVLHNNVFKAKLDFKFLSISLIILIPYTNFFFFEQAYVFPSNYLQAVLNVLLFSAFALPLILVLYFLFRKKFIN